MVIILGTSSLHRALETFPTGGKKPVKEQVCNIPGLSFNSKTKQSQIIERNFLDMEVEDKNNVVLSHILTKSLSRHKSNRSRSLLVPELIAILNKLENRLTAPVRHQNDQRPNIVEEPKKQSNTILHSGKNFVSSKKQNSQDFPKQFRASHQIPEIEFIHLQLLLRNDCDPHKIGPERLSKRARKALKNVFYVVM